MVRFPLLVVAGALSVSVATGCGAGKPLSIDAHPTVRSVQLPSAKLRQLQGDRALLLTPSKLVFMTTGGVSCAWWPARLTALDRSSIQIDMRVNGQLSRCGSGAVGFPITVKVDPRIIDVHRPVTVRLAYKVGTKQWDRTAVAPAFSRS